MPSDRRPVLDALYELLQLETAFHEHEQQLKAKRVWNIGEEDPNWEAHGRFEAKREQFDVKNCLLCGQCAQVPSRPFFRAQNFERVYCRQHLSGLFVPTNYSITNLQYGYTQCHLCFGCARSAFPRLFQTLAHDLCGTESKHPERDQPTRELVLTEEVLRAMHEEMGPAKTEELLVRGSTLALRGLLRHSVVLSCPGIFLGIFICSRPPLKLEH